MAFSQRRPGAGLIMNMSGTWSLLLYVMMFLSTVVFLAVYLLEGTAGYPSERRAATCDDVDTGYQCQPDVSHNWGQYSGFYSVPSAISADLPPRCRYTFANTLSRHGARFPTASKTVTYGKLVDKIHKAKSYGQGYQFLKNYTYTLGADDLTDLGKQELVNAGLKFYKRYHGLTTHFTPFIRASGQDRVVVSAEKFADGYHQARLADDSTAKDQYPYDIVIVSEDAGQNNTLNHDRCTKFENDPTYTNVGSNAQKKWNALWVPAVTSRLNLNLPGINLTDSDTINFMDLCPFQSVANAGGAVSQFCGLFSVDEWKKYDYYQSLGKYYGYGNGNPLGPTQGVGFVNELIARMTGKPVDDHTSVNQTLDAKRETFPVGGGKALFADFSHDNDITAILAALGLYNTTAPLSQTTYQSPEQTNGYSAAWTVPFAGHAYFEKLDCGGYDEDLVRIVVNDRVVPLPFCGGDALGRCTLTKFVESLSFARAGGKWDQCFS